MDVAPHSHIADLEVALDFVNTLHFDRGEARDDLATPGLVSAWLVEHGLIHDDGGPVGPAVLRRVRRARAALRELVEAADADRAVEASALAAVNRILRARATLELVSAPDGLHLDHGHGRDPYDEALAGLAEPIVREIGAGRRERLRPCANDGCRWLFFDGSRQGRRRWCDMTSCGNRAKAARHRARLRAEATSATAGGGAERFRIVERGVEPRLTAARLDGEAPESRAAQPRFVRER